MQRVILDTDIGTDVDDCLALAVILGSPELELSAATVVYGDVALRARMVCKLLALAGRTGLPVALGARRPLLRRRPVYWAGYEGQGLLEPGDEDLRPASGHAVDLIIHTVMAHPGEVTLIAIGPLTNVALAFLQEPALAQNLAGLVVMGGAVGGAGALHLPWVEHNFGSDPEAAQVVLSAGAPLSIVPLDVTTRVRILPADVARIAAAGDAYHLAVAGQVTRYPRFAARGWTALHDPLAAATVLASDLVSWQPVYAVAETGGEYSAGKLLVAAPDATRPANTRVALDVDGARAHDLILDRILRPI